MHSLPSPLFRSSFPVPHSPFPIRRVCNCAPSICLLPFGRYPISMLDTWCARWGVSASSLSVIYYLYPYPLFVLCFSVVRFSVPPSSRAPSRVPACSCHDPLPNITQRCPLPFRGYVPRLASPPFVRSYGFRFVSFRSFSSFVFISFLFLFLGSQFPSSPAPIHSSNPCCPCLSHPSSSSRVRVLRSLLRSAFKTHHPPPANGKLQTANPFSARRKETNG